MKNCILFLFLSCTVFFSCQNEDEFSDSSVGQINAGDRFDLVISIDNFTWIEGQNSWKEPSKDRLWSSVFTFRSGGEFIYSFDWDGFAFNLIGEYFDNGGGEYSFYGVRNTNNGGGSGTQTLVSGTIQSLGDNEFRVDMEYGASNNTSAIVNNQHFFASSYKRFTTRMTIK